ncbi:MAG: Homoserine kinase [Thermoanaerobacterales bacterium 50_218]|nr:MAG: Homoserine kinase [Thermoanaerobacterales bacterium 50_218]HAA89499.1 homoserine kinase [Peptococcaceae bacterium]
MRKKVVVEVPATTANLGPGFDVLGMALNLYNTVELEECIDSNFQIEIIGEGAETLPRNSENLVFRTVDHLFQKVSYDSPGWKLRLTNRIPLSRGLGSSAAAIVGALVAANLIAGNPLSREEILEEAVLLEGHPDNVAAALFGGVVAVVQEGRSCFYTRFAPHKGLKVFAAVPDFELSTNRARSVLPEKVSLRDAVFNLGHLALLLSALRDGNWKLLPIAVRDQLHQPYRTSLIPGLEDALDAARAAGAYGVFLSGAGPTTVALAPPGSSAGEAMAKVFQRHGFTAKVLELEPSLEGARIVEYAEEGGL